MPFGQPIGVGFVILFVVAGAIVLLVAHAASGSFLSILPTQGTLAGGAKVVSDASAIGGSAVRFGAGTASPTPTPTPGSGGSRDPLIQPFSSTSIWNMPIGSGAVYVPAGLTADPEGNVWAPMPQIDDEQIVMTPTAPLTSIMYNGSGWSGASRCASQGSELAKVPIPTGFVIPNNGANNSAAFLEADGRTVLQSQPFTRCTAGGIATSLLTFPTVDLYGDGISGSHGGSRLSALGGSIRLGELRPGQQGPRHALKVNVDSPYELYKCTTQSSCYRWPALTSDSGSVGNYGSANNNQNTAMKMGALLALPPSVNVNAIGLESVPGKEIAWTLQNYGAYIVDSTGGAAFSLEAEQGPSGTLRNQFQSDYGMPLEQRVNSNTPWSRDLQRLRPLLQVVNNNSASSVGGGGTPRQPLAPPIAP
ncbi:MAG TPA: hypothetical protein VGH44_00840 [Candidatus Saccharimonadia bacterium]|jgi:hypothetical protein